MAPLTRVPFPRVPFCVFAFSFAVVASSVRADLTVTIDTASLVAKTSPTFVGHGWEMWQMFQYLDDMSDPRYVTAASHLGGSVVRVGGITCDWTLYEGFDRAATDSESVPSQPQPLAEGEAIPRGLGFWPTAPANLTRASFETLLDFLRSANLSLLFDLNELLGRNCTITVPGCTWDCGTWCEGDWDTSNVRTFLQYLHDERLIGFEKNSTLIGFELGNELVSHLAPSANIADIQTLAAIVASIWHDVPAADVPRIFAPSTDSCTDFSATQIMSAAVGTIAGFTFHAYPAGSGEGTHALSSLLLNATWLREGILTGSAADVCLADWTSGPAAAGLQLWVTESSSSYSVTLPPPAQNSMLHGMFTLAELGLYARTGVGVLARWALSEASPFGLIVFNKTRGSWDVAADFFIMHIYLTTVSPGVLGVTGDEAGDVLVFAHCSANLAPLGAVTVFAVNVGDSPQSITLSGVAATLPRDEWIFTAPNGNVNSTTPVLNGNNSAPLRLAEDGGLPPMVAVSGSGNALTLPPRSQAFFVLRSAGAQACMGA